MRPPIVLLHGFTQTGAAWGPVTAALDQRYRPLAPDLRGHGAAARARPVSWAAVQADVARWVGEAGGDGPVTLAGYSLGGRVALAAALALGERIDRLVLVGASPGLADPSDRAARRAADAALARRIERDGIVAFARDWAAQPLFAGMSPEAATRAQADRLGQDPGGLAAALRGLGTGVMPPLWDRLGELVAPVALVVGERDERFRAIAREMAARLPSAQVHVVAGAGHAVALERPAAVAALLHA